MPSSASILPAQPRVTLFPYTTLFRSNGHAIPACCGGPLRGVVWEPERLCVASVDPRVRQQGDGVANHRRMGVSIRKVRRAVGVVERVDRKSTRLNSSHTVISYAVFCFNSTRTT